MKLTTLLCMLSLITITPIITGGSTGPLYHECNEYQKMLTEHRAKENSLVREIEDNQQQLRRHKLVACSGLSSCVSCSWYEGKLDICKGQHKANLKIAATLEALLKHKELGHDVTTSVRCLSCAPDTHTANNHRPTTTTTITTTSRELRPAYRRYLPSWPRRLGY